METVNSRKPLIILCFAVFLLLSDGFLLQTCPVQLAFGACFGAVMNWTMILFFVQLRIFLILINFFKEG